MRRTKPVAAPMVARVYRVSTDAQDLEHRGDHYLDREGRPAAVAGIYREGIRRADRPELLRQRGIGILVVAEPPTRVNPSLSDR